MTISHWQRSDLGAPIQCDVAVVGGGIVGSSTAYWIKQLAPQQKVVLVEGRTIGHGASGRNAGFLLQGAAVDYVTDVKLYGTEKASLLWDFTTENRRLVESQLDAGRIELQGGGSLILAGSDEEAHRLQQSEAHLQKKSAVVRYWDVQAVREKTKGVGFFGGLCVETGARVHSLKLVREIAGTSGAMVLEHHSVTAVEARQNDVRVQTTQREIVASNVVLCLNAYVPQLMPEISSLIRPVRAQMMATESLPQWLPYPVYSHEGYYYLRQLSSGALLLGGARHLHVEEEVGYEDATTPELQESLKKYLARYFPHVPPVHAAYSWSGVMGFTPDGLPIFGEIPGRPGCFIAAGFNGHGMGYGFQFGKSVAGQITGQGNDQVFRDLFDISRFEETSHPPA